MTYATNRTQDLEFWRERLKEAGGDYLRAVGVVPWGKINEAHRPILDTHIHPQNKVLDVACGIGRVANWFAHYVGIDFVPEFIDIARHTHKKKKFLVHDIKKPFPFSYKKF